MRQAVAASCLALVFATAAVITAARDVSAEPAGCRSAELSAAQEGHRRTAVILMRSINRAQASFMAAHDRYATSEELAASGRPVPTGTYATSVITDGTQHSVLMQVNADACSFALFSNQRGVIFVGAPMR